MAANTQVLLGLYAAIYVRSPDKQGYDFWNNGITAGTLTTRGSATAFSARPEWATAYPTTMTDSAYVDKIYLNVLGIAGDANGRAFWTNAISSGSVSRTNFVSDFVAATLDFNPNDAAFSTLTQAQKDAATGAQTTIKSKVSFSETWVASAAATDPNLTGVDAQGNYVATNDKSVALLKPIIDTVTLQKATDDVIRIIDLERLKQLGLKILDTPTPILDGNGVFTGLTLIATGLDPSLVHVNELFNQSSAATTNTYSTAFTAFGKTLGTTKYFADEVLLTGAGVTVGVWDGTHALATHQEFMTGTGSRVTFGDAAATLPRTTTPVPLDNHSTHVAGTIGAGKIVGGASGVDPSARGMAPGVLTKSYDFYGAGTDITGRFVDFSELKTAAENGLLLSNHSYGFKNGWNGLVDVIGLPTGGGLTDWWFENITTSISEDPDFGLYSAHTQALDTILNANKNLLSVWAAGNDRDDHNTNINPGKYVARLPAGSITPSGFTVLSDGWYLIDTKVAIGFPAPAADGNAGAGYDSLPQVQTAKNSLVVGAVDNAKATAGFSNWGPTDDGRLGVHLMGVGVGVHVNPNLGPLDPNPTGVYSPFATSNTAYGTMDGTSMAAPNVTGSIALLEELHQKLYQLDDTEYKNVQTVTGATRPRFLDTVGPITPTSATMKGLVLHTASELNKDGPDFQTGYGLLDAKAAGDFLNGLKNPYVGNKYLLAEDTYKGTAVKLGEINYDGAAGGIKVTLVWNDAAPTVLPTRGTSDATIDNTTKVLVNDLDLYVKGPDKFYYPWHLEHLDPLNPNSPITPRPTSTTHTAADIAANGDHLNNVEQVFIPQISGSTVTPSGKYQVFVGGQLAAGQTAQDFSIFFTALPTFGAGNSYGDVHIKTFDSYTLTPTNDHGKQDGEYDFQSIGEFVLIESTTDDWQIQTRQKASLGSSAEVAVNTAFATMMDGYKVVFDRDNPTDKKITINGTAVTLLEGKSLAVGASIIERVAGTYGSTYTLRWAGADGILGTTDDDLMVAMTAWDTGIHIDVKPANYRAGSVRGLLGNGDGDVSNDFTLRDGTLLSTTMPNVTQIHNAWANSWLVNAAGTDGHAKSLFSTTTAFVANEPSTPVNAVALTAATVLVQNAAIAVGGITNATVLNNIAFDYVVTGDRVFIDSGVAFFAQLVTLDVSPATVTEGSGSLIYTFTRTGNANNTVTVNYAIDGTATADDYTVQGGVISADGKTGSVTFAVGAETATVTLVAKTDAIVEPTPETVRLLLSAGTNYNVGTTTRVVGTITDGLTPTSGFVLTTGTDTFTTLTTANDTITGGDGTLGADIIIDNTTFDADLLTATGVSAGVKPAISKIETISISNTANTGLDLSNILGTKTLNLATTTAGGTAVVTNAKVEAVETIFAKENIATLNVSAASTGAVGELKISAGNMTAVTFNGSTSADSVAVITDTSRLTINLGDGDDTFVSPMTIFATGFAFNVDGGVGTDTLVLKNGTDISKANLALTNMETIAFDNAGGAITFSAAQLSAKAYNIKGSAAADSLIIKGSSDTTTVDVSKLKITSVETVTLDNSTSTTAQNLVGVITLDKLNNNLISGAGNDTVNGGFDNDTITGGAGNDSLSGGMGADIFAFKTGDSGLPSATSFDTITDFTTMDRIDFGATVLMVVAGGSNAVAGKVALSAKGAATFNAADTTLAQHIAAVSNTVGTVGVAAVWQEGSDAYLFVDGDGAASPTPNALDVLIKLTGLNMTVGNGIAITAAGDILYYPLQQ